MALASMETRLSQSTVQIRDRTRRLLDLSVLPVVLRGRVQRLHGPATVTCNPDELVTLTVVRNGRLHVKSFVQHHLALGAKHLVFLDNGSDDDTVARLCAYDRVTVLRCDVPYSRYENALKSYLAHQFASNRWSLTVDIDELFDYPLSNELPLSGFLEYLNARGFTAVVTQMLDMFADGPLSEVRSDPDDLVNEVYRYYDISNIDRPPYEWSHPANPLIRMHWGGIRRSVFGTSNGLTKAALVRLDGQVQPFVQWHHVVGARVADVTGLLRHYPFVGTFYRKVEEAVRTGRYGATTSQEYEAYARALERDPHLTLRQSTADLFTGMNSLIDSGFLTVSDDYRRWVARQDTPSGTQRHARR